MPVDGSSTVSCESCASADAELPDEEPIEVEDGAIGEDVGLRKRAQPSSALSACSVASSFSLSLAYPGQTRTTRPNDRTIEGPSGLAWRGYRGLESGDRGERTARRRPGLGRLSATYGCRGPKKQTLVIRRGQIWWVDFGDPRGSEPANRHPALVIQRDEVNESCIDTVVVCVLTSNPRFAKAPGNTLLRRRQTGLTKDSVANASQLAR